MVDKRLDLILQGKRIVIWSLYSDQLMIAISYFTYWCLGMNLIKIWIWLNPHNMIIEVILNQDSILDFLKCPHILSICHWEYHSWISVYFFICKLIGWWRQNKTMAAHVCKCRIRPFLLLPVPFVQVWKLPVPSAKRCRPVRQPIWARRDRRVTWPVFAFTPSHPQNDSQNPFGTLFFNF